ncbi:MAG: hypothetical protein PCFJNLEI_01504 [Verrucomicrobiae bacterium]|nr:hypothetical protein [Verrucomicrobiae bacterium]
MSTPLARYGTAIYGVARYTSASSDTGGRKRMAEVALNLRNLSVNDKITKGRAVTTAAGTIEGTAVLGAPLPPEAAEVTTKTDALEFARDKKAAADNAAKLATQELSAAERAWNTALADYGRLVGTKSGGVAAKINACGLDVAGTPTPIGEMPQVLNLVATIGDLTGEVDLAWNPAKGSKTYIVQHCEDPLGGAWTQFDLCTASKITVTGLVSGKKYWFRVAAKGSAPGQGPWSDPALSMAA